VSRAARRLGALRHLDAVPEKPAVPMLPPGLVLDLLAAVLAAGVPVPAALSALADALAPGDVAAGEIRDLRDRLLGGDPEGARSGGSGAIPALEGALTLAARAGLPPAELIRAAGRRERARRAADRRSAIRRLEVLLVVPAGLCLLPAFVLIGVVPVVIALLSG
jgi:hypothetical protein